MAKYTGSGKVESNDFHKVKWVGVTKAGNAITIELEKAINMGDIDLSFLEKGETVAQIVMTAVYKNTDNISDDTTEPWTLDVNGELLKPSGEIILGVGKFYIDDQMIALTRGGGNFNVKRTWRNINADGDRGPVEDRITIDESVASLTMNSLQILSKFKSLYAGIKQLE